MSASPSTISTSAPPARRRATRAVTRSSRARERSSGVTPESYRFDLGTVAPCRPPPTPDSPPRGPRDRRSRHPPPRRLRSPRRQRRSLPEPSADASAPGPEAPAEPAETAEPTLPFEADCASILTAEALAASAPGYTPDPAHEPRTALGKRAAELDGTVCGWTDPGGAALEVLVATPAEAAGESLRNAAITAAIPVPTYGTPPEVEGYFHAGGDRGTAQVFTGPYWIAVDSTAYAEPGDPQPLVAAVIAALPPA
ncbi:hypothetical protein [Agromyces archimandritae]|uniref:Iron ABC transporter ATP-binding protein n=1 Tax=Agromyces archimandritae TaxID=2781962 RepID=A0A975FPB4_9MICO|nr:hypothetical protein [Agromyces archimandritae]QTX05173.1 hypothetical protein G127AT_02765 [Agromyces archimandritae]